MSEGSQSWVNVYESQNFLEKYAEKLPKPETLTTVQTAADTRVFQKRAWAREILRKKKFALQFVAEPLRKLNAFSRTSAEAILQYEELFPEDLTATNTDVTTVNPTQACVTELFYHLEVDEEGEPVSGMPLRDLELFVVTGTLGRLVRIGKIALPYNEQGQMCVGAGLHDEPERLRHGFPIVHESYLIKQPKSTLGLKTTGNEQGDVSGHHSEEGKQSELDATTFHFFLRVKFDDADDVLVAVNKELTRRREMESRNTDSEAEQHEKSEDDKQHHTSTSPSKAKAKAMRTSSTEKKTSAKSSRSRGKATPKSRVGARKKAMQK